MSELRLVGDGEEGREEEGLEAQEEIQDPHPRTEFITGQAGTGKTFLVKQRADEYPGQVLCATTGIAAVNLGEGVTTINSLIGYFDTASLRDMWTGGFLGAKLFKLAKAGLRRVILDEVSMLDGEQLTILTAAFDELNERLEQQGDHPVSITLTGDFCQLPPVKAIFAFEVEQWARYAESTTKLTEIRRQADKDFIQALGFTRAGLPSKAVPFFAPMMRETTDPNFQGTTLFSKNDEVDRYNLLRASKLQSTPMKYKAERWGKGRSEWKQVPDELALKEGALVMCLANQKGYDEETGQPTGDYRYVNGDLADVVEMSGASLSCHVKMRRTGAVEDVQMVTRNNLIPLEPGRRKELRSSDMAWRIVCSSPTCQECQARMGRCRNAKYEIIGQLTYMPLRLAYATTVHKSQGLSLDEVQIDFRGHFYESYGMLYVALSRARSAAGLRLVGRAETFIKRCRTDPKVKGWL